MAARWLFALFVVLVLPFDSRAEEPHGLNVYFIDVEGGAATLIVTPQGESILIDNGFPGSRDAERIHQVATAQAGLKAIDHLIITHWHTDHYGGTARLAKLIPIHNYYDHGIPEKLDEDPKNFPLLIQAYRADLVGWRHQLVFDVPCQVAEVEEAEAPAAEYEPKAPGVVGFILILRFVFPGDRVLGRARLVEDHFAVAAQAEQLQRGAVLLLFER